MSSQDDCNRAPRIKTCSQEVIDAWHNWRGSHGDIRIFPLCSSNRIREPHVYRLESNCGEVVVAKRWPDRDRLHIESTILKLLSNNMPIKIPLMLWLDQERLVGFMEWCGNASLADLLHGQHPKGSFYLHQALRGLAALEAWFVVHKSSLQQLYSSKNRMPAEHLSREIANAVKDSTEILLRRSVPSEFSSSLECNCNAIAKIVRSQPQSVGIGDLSPDDVLVDGSSNTVTFVDFEVIGTSSPGERLVAFCNQPGIPVGEHALPLLDEYALAVFSEEGGVASLELGMNRTANEVMDCCVLVRYWRFIADMLELSRQLSDENITDVAAIYGPPQRRARVAIFRYLACPRLSFVGPASEFRRLIEYLFGQDDAV